METGLQGLSLWRFKFNKANAAPAAVVLINIGLFLDWIPTTSQYELTTVIRFIYAMAI